MVQILEIQILYKKLNHYQQLRICAFRKLYIEWDETVSLLVWNKAKSIKTRFEYFDELKYVIQASPNRLNNLDRQFKWFKTPKS